MQKVKLIKFIEEDYFNGDLTIGNVYKVESVHKRYKGLVVTIEADDRGDQNELYEGEYEVVE